MDGRSSFTYNIKLKNIPFSPFFLPCAWAILKRTTSNWGFGGIAGRSLTTTTTWESAEGGEEEARGFGLAESATTTSMLGEEGAAVD
jgi:hypothetical protein